MYNLKKIISILAYQIFQIIVIMYVYEINIFDVPYYTYSEMIDYLTNNNTSITKLIIDETYNKAYFFNDQSEIFKVKISRYENFLNVIKQNYNKFNGLNVIYDIKYDYISSIFIFIKQILSVFIIIFAIKLIISFLVKLFLNIDDKNINTNMIDDSDSSLGIESMFFSNNIFKISKNIQTRFDNIIGQENVKNDLKQYIHFLNNRSEYIKYGVKVPKGLLFTGQPGTGKTLLAKALAGESNVAFINASGSDFSGMFVGQGQQRVKQLFNLARKNAPCIVFIDEIDSVGKNRNNTKNLSHSEHSTTLNQLLVQMDGFVSSDNVIIIGATNMKDSLDPALLRSGRFDRNIVFDLPNLNERKELFELYMKPIILDQTILSDKTNIINELSKLTSGLSGADIANIINQSTINSLVDTKTDTQTDTKTDTKTVKIQHIMKAIDEIIVGFEKKERLMSSEEKKIVSYHEAGHCLLSYLLKGCTKPIKVSIVPRGDAALGFSQSESDDRKLWKKSELFDRLCMIYGGRIAEEIIFSSESITTGASDDIEKATKLAYSMVTKYGFDDKIGKINYGDNLSQKTQYLIDAKVKKILSEAYDRGKDILERNKDYLEMIAHRLLEKEILYASDLEEIMPELASSI
jgi:ATP-dependent metalloprotease FtsH